MTTKLQVLKEHARITQAVFDDYWEYVRNNDWLDINWNVMESMADRANTAANELREAEDGRNNGTSGK